MYGSHQYLSIGSKEVCHALSNTHKLKTNQSHKLQKILSMNADIKKISWIEN